VGCWEGGRVGFPLPLPPPPAPALAVRLTEGTRIAEDAYDWSLNDAG
jgi:hypothetical protein